MNAHESHEMAPEFRAQLEWQIASALRRESRFATPVAVSLRRLRAAVAVLAVLAVGSMAVVASAQVQNAKQRDTLVEMARAEEMLVALRLDLARAAYQEAQRGFEVGTTGRESLQEAERQVRTMELRLARIRLDIEEIQSTSAAPRNDLQAPLVGKRDFVRDRLALELEAAQRALVTAEQGLRDAQVRVEVGTGSRGALAEAEARLHEARGEMLRLKSMLDLRLQSLNGTIKIEDMAIATRRLELTLRRDWLVRELQAARTRVQEVRGRVDTGLSTQLELKRAEVEALEREIELQKIRREIESLGGVRRN